MRKAVELEDTNGCTWFIYPGYVTAVCESSYRALPPGDEGTHKPTDVLFSNSWQCNTDMPIEVVMGKFINGT